MIRGKARSVSSGQSGIEASSEADSNAFLNNAIRLAAVRREDDGLVCARDKLL